ncbi:MAG: hypothetical protein RBT34_09710 [Anaerolineaceae bacterium]|nr:hypothetical protein [Anaerolineaceae bacterium]
MKNGSRKIFSWQVTLPMFFALLLIGISLVFQTVQDFRAVQNLCQLNIRIDDVLFKVVYPKKLFLEEEDGQGQPLVISAFDQADLPSSEIYLVIIEPGEFFILKDAEGKPTGNVFELQSGSPERGAVKVYLVPTELNDRLPRQAKLSIALKKQAGVNPVTVTKRTVFVELENLSAARSKFLWKHLFGETALIFSIMGIVISGLSAFFKIRNEQIDRQAEEEKEKQVKDKEEKKIRQQREIKNLEELILDDVNVIKAMRQYDHLFQQSKREDWAESEVASLEAMRRRLAGRQGEILRLTDETYREDEQGALEILELLQSILNAGREE